VNLQPDREVHAMADSPRDLMRVIFAVLFVGALIGMSFWILKPFLGAAIWAATIVVATWPLMLSIQERLWGKRALAVAVMTVLLLCILIIPLWLAIDTIVENVDPIAGWVKSLTTFTMPPPPAWLGQLPLVGDKAVQAWEAAMKLGMQEFVVKAAPYAGGTVRWFAAEVGNFGMVIVQFLLTVILAALLYSSGEGVAAGVTRFGHRLAGTQGENAARLAGQAIRGVALGVVVTALTQSVIGGIGLAVAGIPFAGVLTALMFMLAIAQIGPFPVLIPSVIWVFWNDGTAWGTFLLVWTVVVGAMDNVLRPILIRKGANLPLLLIFSGVVGGLIAFGLIGIFVGPVVLAVAYTLLAAWVNEGRLEGKAPAGAPPPAVAAGADPVPPLAKQPERG
jgi:predicted PurR-regulated permease PerM